MKPYYDHAGIQIYLGDCREVLPTLAPVDLVLTDPPYGMNYYSGHYKHGNPYAPVANDDHYPWPIISQCLDIATAAVYSFCRRDNIGDLIIKPKSFLVWVKNNWTAGDLEHAHGRAWEGIAFYPREKHKFLSRIPDVIYSNRVPPDKLNHPTEKPLGVMLTIIGANAGNIICDPFMGSGTTLVAAKQVGRKGIGVEIEEKYAEIAAKRLSQEMLPFGD